MQDSDALAAFMATLSSLDHRLEADRAGVELGFCLLGRLPSEEAVQWLATRLDPAQPGETRLLALRALEGNMGKGLTEEIRRDSAYSLRFTEKMSLSTDQYGRDLRALLEGVDIPVDDEMIRESLARMRGRSYDPLLLISSLPLGGDILEHKLNSVAFEAIFALAQRSPSDDFVVRLIQQVLVATQPVAGSSDCVYSDPRYREVTDWLFETARHGVVPSIREAAIAALGRSGGEPVRRFLFERVADVHDPHRATALRALLVRRDEQVQDTLRSLARHDIDDGIRKTAVASLQVTEQTRDTDFLLLTAALLHDSSPDVRVEAGSRAAYWFGKAALPHIEVARRDLGEGCAINFQCMLRVMEKNPAGALDSQRAIDERTREEMRLADDFMRRKITLEEYQAAIEKLRKKGE